jgi:membrane protein involved in colicin uptake
MKTEAATGAETPDFGQLRTVGELIEAYNDMVPEAQEHGMVTEAVTEFQSVEYGQTACARLHDLIVQSRQRRARAEARAKASTNQNTDTDKTSASATAPAEPVKKAATTKKASGTSKGRKAAPKKETKKMATSTKAKAKKASAKKSVKKAASAKANGGERVRLADDAKITVISKENPYREGSAVYDRVKNALASNGRTVGTFVEKGGRRSTLLRLIEQKLIRVGA